MGGGGWRVVEPSSSLVVVVEPSSSLVVVAEFN